MKKSLSRLARLTFVLFPQPIPCMDKTADVKQWSIEQVSAWLTDKGFIEIVETFTRNDVDGDLLLRLDDDILKDKLQVHVGSFGKRDKILRAIHQLKLDLGIPEGAAGPATTTAATTGRIKYCPGEESLPKRPRIALQERCEDLFDLIMKCPEDSSRYSSQSPILKIPFPYVGYKLPTDRFQIQLDHHFDYMGRLEFARVLEAIEKLDYENGSHEVFVYGTIGYGKSHILAAMACYLLRNGKKVVYLPDCRAMAANYLLYIQAGLHLAFVGDESYQDAILECTSDDKMKSFCNIIANKDIQLYFIIDQLNSLDPEVGGTDDFSDKKKIHIRSFLDAIICQHFAIKSASANVNSARYMVQKQTSDIKLSLVGGMKELEMDQWWRNYNDELPLMTDQDKQRAEDMTGRIPLLLKALLTFGRQNFTGVESEFLSAPEVRYVLDQVHIFASKKKKELTSVEWAEYMKIMNGCLTQTEVPNIPYHYDHRYFFIDENNVGNYTCGLARESMVRTLRELGEDNFLGPEWRNNFLLYKNNPSVLGFYVEQICLSSISQKGIKAGHLNFGAMRTIIFRNKYPIFNTNDGRVLYVPFHFNFKAIDGLILECSVKTKTFHLIPIQITIAKHHSRSESTFFAEWKKWTQQLEIPGFNIRTTFLWITEAERDEVDVPLEVRDHRSGSVLLNPKYTKQKITVEDVNFDAGTSLANARRS